MCVLITGGHGHIGSWTAYLLALQGRHVIIMDVNPAVPEILEGVYDRITFIQGDVMDFPGLKAVFRKHADTLDGVVHTVGIMADFMLQNPRSSVMINVGGLVNVLEAARVFRVPKIVYTSSGAIYGPLEGVASEQRHLPNPADLYASTKASAELIGLQYQETFGLDFRICRLYFVYGPGRIPSQFIRLYQLVFGVLEGIEGLHADRGGDQRLDFTHVEDAARGLMLLYCASNPSHRIYNIATGRSYRMREVVGLAQEAVGAPVSVDLGPGILMPRCHALEVSRARKDLGYTPQIGLAEGISGYAAWLLSASPDRGRRRSRPSGSRRWSPPA